MHLKDKKFNDRKIQVNEIEYIHTTVKMEGYWMCEGVDIFHIAGTVYNLYNVLFSIIT